MPDQLGLARRLHPLVSVDLSAANPDWSGWTHILSPLQRYGLPGEHGAEFHNAHARNRALYWLDDQGAIEPGHEDNPQCLVDQVGGTAAFGNWTVGFAMPFDPPLEPGGAEPDAVWPLSPAGRRFELAVIDFGYSYRERGRRFDPAVLRTGRAAGAANL